jgi:hypothetical protein
MRALGHVAHAAGRLGAARRLPDAVYRIPFRELRVACWVDAGPLGRVGQLRRAGGEDDLVLRLVDPVDPSQLAWKTLDSRR